MVDIRIKDLPLGTPAATKLLPMDLTTTERASIRDIVFAGRPSASQAEAEAGTNAEKVMTPLTTKQSIASEVGNTIASAAQGDLADSALQVADVSTVAITGQYDDLLGRPEIGSDIVYEALEGDTSVAVTYVPGTIRSVYRNGVRQSQWAATDGLTVTFPIVTAADIGDDGICEIIVSVGEDIGGSTNFNDARYLRGNPPIEWGPFQTRILATKTHADGEAQSLLDIQVNARDGTIDGDGGIGSGVSITGRGFAGTKYGMFGTVMLFENFSTFEEGVDPFFAHAAAVSYINQHTVDAAPGFSHAFEVKETHGDSDPVNGSLGSEHTVIATGTDANDKRTMIFLPTNKLNPGDGIFTEFAHGIFWKTSANTKYKNAMFLEGQYDAILNASGVSAQNLIVATGSYSAPVIDLHALTVSGGVALALNLTHSLQFQNALGVGLGGLGYSTDTLLLAGVKLDTVAGSSNGYIEVNINGTRKKIQTFNLT